MRAQTSFFRYSISGLFFLSTIAYTAAIAQPKQLNNCDGVYEFYGNPSPASNRGSGLKILFYIGERENILQCFKNSRMAIGKPLREQLSSRKYSKIDEQLLRSTAMQLELKDPYLANGGI